MNDSTKILYREIVERYVKVIWTHKIQLCQASIYRTQNKRRSNTLTIFSVLVSASAITHLLSWLPECIMIPVIAILSLILTYFTTKYKSDNLGKSAYENESFAATMHHLRNRYAGLLSEIKAGTLNDQQIVERRNALEHDENLIYSGIVPFTSAESVSMAERALKTNQESTTTDEEIRLMVSDNLQM